MGLARTVMLATSLVAFGAAGAGCAQTAKVRTDGVRGELEVGGKAKGEIGPSARSVDIPFSLGKVPYAVVTPEGERLEGVIEKDGPLNWWIIGPAICGALVCSPSLACGGAMLANPLLPVVTLTALGAAETSGLTCAGPAAAIANPTCLTVPMVCAGGMLGLAPLTVLPFAERLPDEVVLSPTPVADVTADREEGSDVAPAAEGDGGDDDGTAPPDAVAQPSGGMKF